MKILKAGLVIFFILTAGCSRVPEPLPDILPPPVYCVTPQGLTEIEEPPVPPRGEYTQRDVSRYIILLKRWGVRAQERLVEVREFSDRCRRGD